MKNLKRTLVLLLLVLPVCASGPHAREQPGLYLSITETRTEHSRDSDSIVKTITVENGMLRSEETSRRRKPVHTQFKLSNDEVSRLEALIRRNHLLDSSNVEGPERSGPHTSLDLSIKIRLKNKHSTIRITGTAQTEELDTNLIYRRANELLDALKDLVEGHHEGRTDAR